MKLDGYCSSCFWFKHFLHFAGHLEKCEGAIPHFSAKIAPNCTILAKLHYDELFGQNPLFHTFGPKLHFFALFGKNRTSLKQNRTFFQFFPHFSRCPDFAHMHEILFLATQSLLIQYKHFKKCVIILILVLKMNAPVSSTSKILTLQGAEQALFNHITKIMVLNGPIGECSNLIIRACNSLA